MTPASFKATGFASSVDPSPNSQISPAFRQTRAPTSAYTRYTERVKSQITYYHDTSYSSKPVRGINERDILESRWKFLRTAEDDGGSSAGAAHAERDEAEELTKRYYDNLYKEFALLDLSRWEEGLCALRWRTREELVIGRGEVSCAELNCGKKGETLNECEMNFGYVEEGVKKNALVKVRVCRDCWEKLESVKNKGRRRGRERRSRERSDRRINRREKSRSLRSRSRDGSRSCSASRVRNKRHEDRENERIHKQSEKYGGESKQKIKKYRSHSESEPDGRISGKESKRKKKTVWKAERRKDRRSLSPSLSGNEGGREGLCTEQKFVEEFLKGIEKEVEEGKREIARGKMGVSEDK